MTELDNQNEEVRSGGGHRRDGGRDSRVTSAAQWAANVLQALVVVVLGAVAKNLWEVNLTLAADGRDKVAMQRDLDTLRSELNRNDVRDDVQGDQISNLNSRVSAMDGRNTRGGPTEPRRAN